MQKTKKNKTDIILYDKPILKGMLLLALPVFLNNILKSFHDMVDLFFIARIKASEHIIVSAIAAVNIHFPTYFFFLAIGTGLGVAAVTIVSQYLGSKRKDLAQVYASRIVAWSVITGLAVTLIMIFTAPFLIKLMGATDHTYDFALQYFIIRAIEFVPVFLFIAYQSIRQAEGKTVLPGIINISGIIINVFFTWLFVSKLEMGIAGAAWATVIGQSISLPFVIYGLVFSKGDLTIKIKETKVDRKTSADIFKLMLPAMLATALNSLGFIIIQSRLLSYSETVSSGFSAGNRISQLVSNALMSVSTVMATYIGNNVGNNNPKRARESYITALVFITAMSVLLVVIFIFIRKFFIQLLLGKDISQEVMDLAMTFAFVLLLTQPMMAIIWSDNSYFNGSGNAMLSFISSMIRLWLIRIPLIYIIALIFPSLEYHSIWISMIISNVAIIIINIFLKRRVTLERTVRFDELAES